MVNIEINVDILKNPKKADISGDNCNSEQKLCRLCGSWDYKGFMVFNNDGLNRCLQHHIKKYLYIMITVDDKLTKFICSGCTNTLENIHKFARKATQNQRKLENSTFDKRVKISSNNSILHAYLTDDCIVNDHDYTTIHPTKFSTIQLDQPIEYKRSRKMIPNDIERPQRPKLTKKKTHSKKGKGKENCSLIQLKEEITEGALIKSECIIDEPTTSDSNTHETLEVVVDPSLYLDCSCDSIEDNSTVLNPLRMICGKDTPHEGRNECFSHLTENNNNDLMSPESIDQTLAFGSDKGYDCPICGKNNFTERTLLMHLRIHRPKGKHECNICKRIFKSNANLLQHKIFHTRVQYQCKTCSRVYATHSTLKAHAITHSELRPHQCQLCEKSFKRNQDLKFHMNQHTGERPYKCIYCSRAFASSGNCFSHRKRMHPNEMERDQNFAAKILM